jgi:hypothetical protein
VNTVITTSAQCGSEGFSWTRSTGLAFGARLAGGVIRVVEMLRSPDGRPLPGTLTAAAARQLFRFTISIWIAPVGQADTQAGDWPRPRREWHMSHFPTTPRSGLYCGTPYEQFHVQYWQPMHASALCRTMPVPASFL